MPLRATDSILSPRKVDPDLLVNRLDGPSDQDRAFARAAVKWAEVAGVDPGLVLIQWLLETANAESPRWNIDRNSSGIGIVANDTDQPFVIPDVDASARLHIQTLYSLVNGELHPGIPLWKEADAWMNSVWLPKVRSGAMPNVERISDLGLRYVEGGRPRATWSFEDGIVPQDTYGKKLVSRAKEFYPEMSDQAGPAGITFGLVPPPEYIRMIVPKGGPGNGYDVCPPRHNIGAVPHETQGDPAGEGIVELEWYFRFFSCPNGERCKDALVDWCCARDGTAAMFNDPHGTREPYASGGYPPKTVGEGGAWNARFGPQNRNRILQSVEFIKTDTARLTAAQIAWGATLFAWIADMDGQPWNEYPYPSKHGGTLQLLEHRQLSPTSCGQHPDDIAAMRAQTRARMKQFQESGGVPPATTTPAPGPVYAKPVPIRELEVYATMDPDLVPATVVVGRNEFIFVNDQVKAKRDTRRRQYADLEANPIGPDIKKGEDFSVLWLVEAGDGKEYYLTRFWTRVLVADTERISD